MKLLNQYQEFDDYRYRITDLIEASKNLTKFKLKVNDIYIDYQSPCRNTLSSFIEHCKNVSESDLTYPIILSLCNFILDGKHRVAKALIEGKTYINAVRFEEMPNCGEFVED